MKVLRVGDPHAKVNNLAEMRKLIEYVLATARLNEVDRIELLGDLFHTHAVLRLEVQEFWAWALFALSSEFETVVLVGNHDQSGDYSSTFSALSLFRKFGDKNLIIVEEPLQLGVFGYVPYTHGHDTFISSARNLGLSGVRVLVCHQTIQGSKYESGFYAQDGVPTGEWSKKFLHVISGHIHSEQRFENIIYPGTARWDSVTDTNMRKGIWIFDHEEDGTIRESSFFSTEHVCSPLREVSYNEGDPEPTIPEGRVALIMTGSSEWVRREKEKFKDKVSIRTKFTDVKVTEKRNGGKNFEDFMRNLFVSSMNREHLLKLAKEMGIV